MKMLWARVLKYTLEREVTVNTCAESAKLRDHQPVSPGISRLLLTIITFPSEFGKATAAGPCLFLVSITHEFGNSSSSYTDTPP